MALVGSAQFIGNVNSTIAEVELNTKAMRKVIRPGDVKFLGSFNYVDPQTTVFSASTNGAGGQGATLYGISNTPFSLITTGLTGQIPNLGGSLGTVLCAIKRISYQYTVTVAGTGAAGYWQFGLYRSYGNITSGTTSGLTANARNRRGQTERSYGSLQFARCSSITSTSGFCGFPVGQDPVQIYGVPAGLGTGALTTGWIDLWNSDGGAYPLILEEGECLAINQDIIPTISTATTTVQSLQVEWDEYLPYGQYYY
jgi:hypothetical protein